MEENKKNLKQIMEHRIQKLNEIKNHGIDPYPYYYKTSSSIQYIIDNQKKILGKKYSIAGRIISLRKMGKVTFLNIQDSTNNMQLYIKKDNLKDNLYDIIIRKLDIGDIVGSEGKIFFTKTNELSINVNEFIINEFVIKKYLILIKINFVNLKI